MGVIVLVAVGVGVAVPVGVMVTVAVGVCVRVGEAVRVCVMVGLALGAGVTVLTGGRVGAAPQADKIRAKSARKKGNFTVTGLIIAENRRWNKFHAFLGWLPRYNKNMNLSPATEFAPDSPYRRLALSLGALPNRFPPAADDSHLRLLAKIFTLEEANLAADLLPEAETPSDIATRLGRDARETASLLKDMVKKGLIAFGKTPQGRPGFGLMPFVVGIYEMQNSRLDAEMARLFEDYFMSAFGGVLEVKPQVHRVIPIGASIKNTMEVQPFENASGLVERAQSWGVSDCICRKQKTLIGEPCGHPLDVCMILSDRPDAIVEDGVVHPLTKTEALRTLQRAASAGLVHCVSNNQRDTWYICNCCTCSCGVLRGMVDLGIANVVARSAFINRVDETLCTGCGECLDACQFNALSVDVTAQVSEIRCAGCGACVLVCQQGALGLERREDALEPPVTTRDWLAAREHAPR